MTPVKILRLIWNETQSSGGRQRTPEPHLVMDDAEQVEAFSQGGEEALLVLYVMHLEKMSKVLAPGMRVLDLGCGSGQLLVMAAEMFPEVEFIGRDLSRRMLDEARQLAARRGAANVSWQIGDMSDLSEFADSSFDGVISSLAFHHLPNEAKLLATFSEIDRLLKPAGALVLSDLGHLQSDLSIRLLAEDRRHIDPPLLVRDYEDSLRAAFSLEDWRQGLARITKTQAALFYTRPIRFFFQIQSPGERQYPGSKNKLEQLLASLPPDGRWNYRWLKMFAAS